MQHIFPQKHAPETQVEMQNMFDPGLNKSDMRYIKNNFFLGKYQMAKSLDTDLRNFFGFGKKPFKTLVKRPGVKFGFKLSNYISPNDSIEEVEKILRKIAEHVSFTKASPVKPIFHKIFKEELRTQYFERHPKKYLIKCRIGVTLSYSNKQKQEMLRTIR